ncbi:hypothetical protein GCM10028798_25490 [Humibacter antri]
MSWWAIVPPVIAAIILVMAPGLVIAYAATARGITAWGLAPALSMTVYTVLALVLGVSRLPWNIGTVALATAILVAIVVVLTRTLLRRFPAKNLGRDPRLIGWIALAGTLLAFAAICIRFAAIFGSPDAISQTFDNNFHLNGVRYIIDTGDANPLTFSDLQFAYNGLGGFYPNLWHAVASLVAESSGASIPVTANALSMVIGGVIWPLGCVVFVRQLVGPKPIELLAAGLFSVGLAAFPVLLITYGVLYPNLLGIALIPAGLSTIVLAMKMARVPRLGPVLGWVSFVGVLPGIALAHPNAFVSLLVIGLPVMCVGWWRWFRAVRQSRPRSTVIAVAIAAVALIVGAAIFKVVRPPGAAATWGPIYDVPKALLVGPSNSQFGDEPAIVITLLAAVGIVAAFVARRNRWLVVSFVFVEALYFFAATLPYGYVRHLLTGTWYSDVNRILAQVPLVYVPLAAIGVGWLVRIVVAQLRRFSRSGMSPRSPGVVAASSVFVLLLAAVAQFESPMVLATLFAKNPYSIGPDSPLLTPDKITLLKRLPHEVPSGAVIAGDPWTGTALAWALSDRRVLVPHIYVEHTPATALILKSLRTATPGSPVCRAIAESGVTYALDFGTNGIFGPTKNGYPGVHHLSTSTSVTLVDRVGDAALYRVTGCH